MSGTSYRRPQPEHDLGLAELRVRIPAAEREHARLRAANRIIRNPRLTEEEKIVRLTGECAVHPDDARALLRCDHSGRVGFRLAGSAASIRRMKQQRQKLERERDRPSIAFTFPGGRIEDHAGDDRLRVFLSPPRQPERAARLLVHGFIFDPFRQCYWRWRGSAARDAVTRLIGISWPAVLPQRPAVSRPVKFHLCP